MNLLCIFFYVASVNGIQSVTKSNLIEANFRLIEHVNIPEKNNLINVSKFNGIFICIFKIELT